MKKWLVYSFSGFFVILTFGGFKGCEAVPLPAAVSPSLPEATRTPAPAPVSESISVPNPLVTARESPAVVRTIARSYFEGSGGPDDSKTLIVVTRSGTIIRIPQVVDSMVSGTRVAYKVHNSNVVHVREVKEDSLSDGYVCHVAAGGKNYLLKDKLFGYVSSNDVTHAAELTILNEVGTRVGGSKHDQVVRDFQLSNTMYAYTVGISGNVLGARSSSNLFVGGSDGVLLAEVELVNGFTISDELFAYRKADDQKLYAKSFDIKAHTLANLKDFSPVEISEYWITNRFLAYKPLNSESHVVFHAVMGLVDGGENQDSTLLR